MNPTARRYCHRDEEWRWMGSFGGLRMSSFCYRDVVMRRRRSSGGNGRRTLLPEQHVQCWAHVPVEPLRRPRRRRLCWTCRLDGRGRCCGIYRFSGCDERERSGRRQHDRGLRPHGAGVRGGQHLPGELRHDGRHVHTCWPRSSGRCLLGYCGLHDGYAVLPLLLRARCLRSVLQS